MSKKDKLYKRLLSNPKDFTYDELITLMVAFGFHENSGGRTSGSLTFFKNSDSYERYVLHKPHPGNILKEYQIKQCLRFLEKWRMAHEK